MRFGISFSFWIYWIFCGAYPWSTFAYFGLTGKAQIPNMKTIDHGSVFMKGNERENVYQWNENGYYTAPSKSYERIDLSPQPDDKETLQDTRSTKQRWQKKPRSTSERMPMNSYRRYSNDQDDVQVKPSSSTSSNHFRRHAEPRPDQVRTRLIRYTQQIRRHPYKPAYIGDHASRTRNSPRPPSDSVNDFSQQLRPADSRPSGRHRSYLPPAGRNGVNDSFGRGRAGTSPKTASHKKLRNVPSDKDSVDDVSSKPVPDSSLQPAIRPLFVSDHISAIMDYVTVDSNGQMRLNSENIQAQPSLTKTDGASDIKERTTSVPLVQVENINRKQARKQCDGLALTRKQRRMCKKDSGLPQILQEAMVTSITECQYQFRFERWNCTIGRTRVHLLSRGNKETAFLYAISSAGLVHSVARGCAKGYLERCLCDETYSDYVNEEAWMWGGCGDNVQAAAKFVRQFLRPKSRSEDIRAEVDKHNSDLGIRMVRHSVTKTCKCHGVSGSCTTKTCWRKVSPFYDIGRRLKNAYNKSVKVGSINSAGGKTKLVKLKRTRRNRPEIPRQNTWNAETDIDSQTPNRETFVSSSEVQSEKRESAVGRRNSTILITQDHVSNLETNPRNNELVYLENSPQYCRRTRYSLGTKGRLCDKHKNCKNICCGRGYTTQVHTVHRSCECEVRWCCYVECKTCLEKIEVHTCN